MSDTTDITEPMVDAALNAWFGSEFWQHAYLVKHYRVWMRRAIDAAIDAVPSGHGERG